MTVRRHEEILDQVKQRHAEEVSVWKENSAENANSLINNVNVAKADIVKMSVESNFILDRFEEHVHALQALVNTNVERKGPLTDAVAKIRQLLESGRSINCSEYSLKISN